MDETVPPTSRLHSRRRHRLERTQERICKEQQRSVRSIILCVVQVEHEIERIAVRAQKELILLHRMGSLKPKGTAQWLKERNWCTFHHHVRCPPRVFERVNLETYVNNPF